MRIVLLAGLLSSVCLISACDSNMASDIDLPEITTEEIEQQVLVSGEINYLKGQQFTHPEDFVFTPESHAVVTLLAIAGEDAPSEVVAEARVSPVDAFPLSFEIKGSAEQALDFREYLYLVDVQVFSEAGDESYVGDLVSEFRNEINAVGDTITIDVTSLENCDSEESGGFCTTKVR